LVSEPPTLCASVTTKHLKIQADEIRSLPFRTSTFAKSVVPQSSSSFHGLNQQYKFLLTRRTHNQCASREETHRPIPGGNTNHATELHRARITTESRRRGSDFLPRRALLVCGDRELSRHTRRLGLVLSNRSQQRGLAQHEKKRASCKEEKDNIDSPGYKRLLWAYHFILGSMISIAIKKRNMWAA
jgi:hypothetical protein